MKDSIRNKTRNKKVLMLLKKDLYGDSRVIKEANSLYKNAFNFVLLFCSSIERKKRYLFETKRINMMIGSKSIFKKIFFHLFLTFKLIYRGIKIKPDICHCHDLNTLLDGYIISLFCKSKLIYDSHELFYEMSLEKKLNRINNYFKKIVFVVFKIVEKIIGKKTDAIITVSDSIGKMIRKNIGGDVKEIYIIKNCVEKNKRISYWNKNIFYEIFPEIKEKIIVLIQGSITEFRFDEAIFDGLLKLKDVVLILLGNIQEDYKNRLLEIIKYNDLAERIFFLRPVDREILYKYTKSADVGLILFKNVSLNHYFALPNKLFEYIACGLPVLSTDMFEIKAIIKKFRFGEVYKEGSSEDFLSNIRKIIFDSEYYRRNCIEAFNYLNWEEEEMKLLKLYNELVK